MHAHVGTIFKDFPKTGEVLRESFKIVQTWMRSNKRKWSFNLIVVFMTQKGNFGLKLSPNNRKMEFLKKSATRWRQFDVTGEIFYQK